MTKIASFLCILICGVALTGCFTFKDLQIGEVQNYSLTKTKKGRALSITLEIENPNGFGISLKKAELQLQAGKQIHRLYLAEKVKLQPKFKGSKEIILTLDEEKLGLLGLAGLALNANNLKLSGKVVVSALGVYQKSFKIDGKL
jgi:LEA14-like dessication related protein